MTEKSHVEEMLQRAKARAKDLGIVVSIAVVDDGGHLLGFMRMEGASFMTVDIAMGKAWTAMAFKTSSANIEKNMAGAPAFASSVAVTMNGRFMPRQGGLVDLAAGVAVGISGGSAEQDESIAAAALGEEH